MAAYSVVVKRSAEKELAGLRHKDLERVVRRIANLAGEPRPPGCEKLSGREAYRVRQGDLRIVYTIDDAARLVTIVKVGNRREVYR